MSPIPSATIHGSVGSSIYKDVTFAPIDIVGTLAVINPDDLQASDLLVGGTEINTCTDQKNGVVFAAPSTARRMLYNLGEKPGHKVAQMVSGDLLTATNAIYNAFNGGTTSVWCWSLHRSTTNSSGYLHAAFYANGVLGGGGTFSGGYGFRAEANTVGYSLLRDATPASGNIVDVVNFTWDQVAWHLWIWQFTGNPRAFEVFKDNVSLGTDASIGALRNPTLIDSIGYGGTNALTPQVSMHGPAGWGTGEMTVTERTKLYDWAVANTWL